jgi:hypothetical protein
VTEKGSKAVRGIAYDVQTEELEGVRNNLRASNIDEKQGAMKDMVARIIDGAYYSLLIIATTLSVLCG